ncbi:MAG: hypothetical protein WC824_04710 [Bacteroidota bacterium]|jgi:hypothetical protein
MRFNIVALLAAFIILAACSSTKEVVTPAPPPVSKETKPVKPPIEREFAYTERYYVKGAVIGDSADIKDPLQAIRVIQLKQGSGEVLVLSSFDKLGEATMETWLGIELPSFKPGSYDLAKARKITFYRFYLGDDRKRIDGQSCEGNLKIESNQDGELIGAIDATINGQNKSFGQTNQTVRVSFIGAFRIKEVDLENTMMKTR